MTEKRIVKTHARSYTAEQPWRGDGVRIPNIDVLFVIADNNVGLGLPRRVGPRHGLAGIW